MFQPTANIHWMFGWVETPRHSEQARSLGAPPRHLTAMDGGNAGTAGAFFDDGAKGLLSGTRSLPVVIYHSEQLFRFAGIKLEIEKMGRDGVGGYLRSNFITDDNGLIEIIKCFTPNVVKHIDKHDGRETQTTMTVKLKDLLTDIQMEEYDHLLNLLNQT
ncbi:hypothetical protein [Zobellella aerophila]|uniref:Uncharacterized protein n=1 Tax=Zobellella aerophila TaxID=870480 RepID=A0ABP6VCC1_9GAMM